MGVNKRNGKLAVFLFSLLILMPTLHSLEFSLIPGATKGNVTQQFSINITNNLSSNITRVNVTLPESFSFVYGSNSTTAENSTFLNLSSKMLVWKNATSLPLIENGTSEVFSFSAIIDSVTGYFNITVIAFFNDTNETKNLTLWVDSIKPEILNFSLSPNVSVSRNNFAYVNATIVEQKINYVDFYLVDEENKSVTLKNLSVISVWRFLSNGSKSFNWDATLANVTNGSTWNYSSLWINGSHYYVVGIYRNATDEFNPSFLEFDGEGYLVDVEDGDGNSLTIANGTNGNSNFTAWLYFFNGNKLSYINTSTFTIYNLTEKELNPKLKFVPVASANYSVKVFAEDLVGNNGSDELFVKVDNDYPLVEIVSPENKSYGKNWLMFNVSVSENVSWCKYSLNGAANVTMVENGSYWYRNVTGLVEGGNNVTFFCSDRANNVNTSTLYFTVDLSPPEVELTFPDNKAWDEDGVVTFFYVPRDTTGVNNCSLWITNEEGNNFSLNKTNDTSIFSGGVNNFTLTLSRGNNENATYKWNVRCYDSFNRPSFSSVNYTLYAGNRSDLVVKSITFNPTSPYRGQSVSVNVTIENTGSRASVNYTRVRFCFGENVNPCSVSSNTTVVLPPLEVNQTYSIIYTKTANTGDGDYYASAEVDYTNNDTMERSDFDGSGNNYLKTYFSTYLNVTVLNVTFNDVYPAEPTPGKNITLKVSVKYFDGSPVTTLSMNNFTKADKWVNGSTDYRPGVGTLHEGDFSQKGSGIYILNYTVPGMSNYAAEYGLHYINLTAKITNYTGSTTSAGYRLRAPNLVASIYGLASTLYHSSSGYGSDTFDVVVYNTGNAYIYNVSVSSIDSNSSGLGISHSCTSISSLAPGSSATICDDAKAEPSALGSYKVYVYVRGNDSVKNVYQAYAYDVVSVKEQGSEQQQQQGGAAPQCTSDEQCPSTYYCSSGTCAPVSCSNGYISNHKCIPYVRRIDISLKYENLTLVQGGRNETEVTVYNKGNLSVKAKARVTVNNPNISFELPESTTILAGESHKFVIKVSAENSTEIGVYDANVRVYDENNEDVYGEKEMKIIVTPTEETKSFIVEMNYNLTSLFDKLQSAFKDVDVNMVSIANYTKANRTYSSLKKLMKELNKSIAKEDYIKARSLEKDINELLKRFKSEVNALEEEMKRKRGEESFQFLLVVVAILLIGGSAGLVIYMLLPPSEGYHPKFGYRPKYERKSKLEVMGELKEKIGSILKHVHRRMRGRQTSLFDFERPATPQRVRYLRHGYEKYISSYTYEGRRKRRSFLKKLRKKRAT